MIQSALVNKLKEITSKVYANVAPLNKGLPVITVDLESSNRSRHYGANGYKTNIIDTDFEITIWSANTGAAYSLSEQVVQLLENYSGPMLGGDSPQTVYTVYDIDIVSESSGFDGTTEIYQYSIFITMSHK